MKTPARKADRPPLLVMTSRRGARERSERRMERWGRRALFVALLVVILPCAPRAARAEDESLGEKIKNFFSSPTPTPSRRHQRPTKKSSPSPTPPRKSKASLAPADEKTSTAKSRKSSPTPEDEEATPRPKKKKKKSSPTPSPSPSPSETPTPTPEESPSPTPTPEESGTPTPSPSPTPEEKVASVAPEEIEGFADNSEPVRKLLTDALDLTTRNLDYKYGSADPDAGGMDCSGFIYFVLRENGINDAPRSASEQYVWVRKAGNFRAVLSSDLDSFELDELKPGDLLFWTGTYSVERDPPVTHTMIYLGKDKKSHKSIMVGSSDGRTYEGERQFGVSVFDFKTTSRKAQTSGNHPRFVGYARIPGLGAAKE